MSASHSQACSSSFTALSPDHEFFRFTRGRFARNEANEMSQRYIYFDVEELARIGAAAVRTVCETPVSKVYSWNSKPNPVGAEYIVMEKVPGVPLDSVWSSMKFEDRVAVVKSIARHQEAWMSVSFGHFGGLYFAQDLDDLRHESMSYEKGGVTKLDETFASGHPQGERILITAGVWLNLTVDHYLTAIGRREIACVKTLPILPKSSVPLYGPGTYRPTKAKKLRALESYLTMIKNLRPVDNSITSCLWHGDIHVENIFVDSKSPRGMVGIIDWQSTELAPLFHHARQPPILDYDGPHLHGLERPSLPEDLPGLDTEAQREAIALYFKQVLCALYRTFIHKTNPRLYCALEVRQSPTFDLLLLARNLLIDGEATYLVRIVELESTWADLLITSNDKACQYPFLFSDEEKAEIERDVNGSLLGMQALQSAKESLRDLFPEQGIVRPEQYEEAKDALRQGKQFIIREFARDQYEEKVWEEESPFDN
ncbi:predicted protein [Uncinocarpus reesii 1704]|uniref:Aminoglycoside phosphotransferase domain-containing protein n=1 Tax=Uncinocarpus reesii (strain UAMH 1704) TaxID=336963 RepID=C4JZR5_UNCRE|nr:uncharacterized protein UREG_07666 [Uncinocarpus reesii 1704]EEP82801.1 predicted protein [Uncinocarpus reesii 1704]